MTLLLTLPKITPLDTGNIKIFLTDDFTLREQPLASGHLEAFIGQSSLEISAYNVLQTTAYEADDPNTCADEGRFEWTRNGTADQHLHPEA